MGSPTRLLKVRRKLTIAGRGRRRKNFNKNHGSTQPNLPLNKPNANEIKQKKASS